jgi:hypothetical protein
MTGVVMGLIAHNTTDLANASGRTLTNPGLGNLQRLDIPDFTRGLWVNHPFLIFVFTWQAFIVIVTSILGPIGIVALFLDRSQRVLCLSLLVITVYYVCTIAMQGLTPDARMRAPLMPLICVFTAVGVMKSGTLVASRI